MIVWVNGAFGSGKTTCAYELKRRLPEAFVFDPENVGFFLRRNMPKVLHKDDFQDHEQWRQGTYEMLYYLSAHYSGVVIVPMTVVNRSYYDAIIGKLCEGGVEVHHFILYASPETLRKRLCKRLELKETWAKQQIERCVYAFDHSITEDKIVTDTLSIDDIVETVAYRAGLTLSTDRRTQFKKLLDRLGVSIRHMR